MKIKKATVKGVVNIIDEVTTTSICDIEIRHVEGVEGKSLALSVFSEHNGVIIQIRLDELEDFLRWCKNGK